MFDASSPGFIALFMFLTFILYGAWDLPPASAVKLV
jgi:hypothetical protein